METFLKARFDLYQQGESLQLVQNVLQSCNNANAKQLKIDAAVAALTEISNSADAAYGGAALNTLTEEVIGLDFSRDEAVIGFKSVVSGFAKHFSPATKNAGKQLVASLNKYSRQIPRENLAIQTTILRNWYNDVTTNTDLKAALVLLNIKDWVDYINTQNEAFDAKYVQRSQTIGNNNQLNTVGDLLPQLQKSFRALLDEIAALTILDKGKGTYTALTNQINALILQYNTRAKNRLAANAAKKQAADNTNNSAKA